MGTKKLKKLSEFEWASVTQYIIYISGVMKLSEISSNQVISFPLASAGSDMIIKAKKRVLCLLERNLRVIELFAGDAEKDLGDSEMSVLRSLYVQYKANIETVRGHIRVATAYQIMKNDDDLFSGSSEVSDDFPF